MTTEKTVSMARALLEAGNASAYARMMSGAIRAASGKRAAVYRAAIIEDDAARFFLHLSTNCPLAKD